MDVQYIQYLANYLSHSDNHVYLFGLTQQLDTKQVFTLTLCHRHCHMGGVEGDKPVP